MINPLQPAKPLDQEHLDPDQLNALAANALPAHERASTLAHLADCAHCRQILFLTQQAEETEAPQPTPATSTWRQWFTSAPIFSAATSALVATLLIAITLHLHRPKPAEQQATLKPQPAPVIAPTPQPAAQPALPTRLGIPPTPLTAVPTPTMTAAAPPPAKVPAPIHSGAVMGGMAGMSSGSGVGAQPTGQIHGAAGGFAAPAQPTIIAGTGAPPSTVNLGNGATFTPRPAPRAVTSGPLQTNQSQLSQMNNFVQQTQPSQTQNGINTAQLSQLPVEGRNSKQLSASSTVSVAAAAPPNLEVTNAAVANLVDSPSLTRQSAAGKPSAYGPLPSKLPTASTVTALNRTLAIDTAGALFLSTDNGRHWTSIHPQWQGKAQTLTLTAATNFRYAAAKKPLPATNSPKPTPDSNAGATIITGAALDALASDNSTVLPPAAPARAKSQPAAPAPPTAAAAPTLAPSAPPSPTFQLTTDTGTIWQSNDGLTWYRR